MRFYLYGVMGSMPGGNSDLGKNSTCLVIEDETSLIIDAGTGLGNYIKKSVNKTHHLLFTHYHLDHVIGLPFVRNLFDQTETFHMYGPSLLGFNSKDLLGKLLTKPLLPIEQNKIKACINHQILEDQKTYVINGFTVSTHFVNHPGGCMVYTVNKGDKKISILTDLPSKIDGFKELITFCKDSDLVYADGTFLDSELNGNEDYGHATVEEVIRLFEASNSKRLVIGHHKVDREKRELTTYTSETIHIGIENNVYNI